MHPSQPQTLYQVARRVQMLRKAITTKKLLQEVECDAATADRLHHKIGAVL